MELYVIWMILCLGIALASDKIVVDFPEPATASTTTFVPTVFTLWIILACSALTGFINNIEAAFLCVLYTKTIFIHVYEM